MIKKKEMKKLQELIHPSQLLKQFGGDLEKPEVLWPPKNTLTENSRPENESLESGESYYIDPAHNNPEKEAQISESSISGQELNENVIINRGTAPEEQVGSMENIVMVVDENRVTREPRKENPLSNRNSVTKKELLEMDEEQKSVREQNLKTIGMKSINSQRKREKRKKPAGCKCELI